MQRVTGLGGCFLKANDPAALAQWYQKHLGIGFGNNIFADFPQKENAINLISFFPLQTEYFHPSAGSTMLNFIVNDLFALLPVLTEEGVVVVGEPMDTEYGKFGWILDPEGNKIELWEPVKNTNAAL
jgi:predicted enzyme related to lactoylglutathione lyase